MLRWLGPRKTQDDSKKTHRSEDCIEREVTDDPLAVIAPNRRGQKIYSVSRVNPIFRDNISSPILNQQRRKSLIYSGDSPCGEKSSSSGYGGSHEEGSSHEPDYVDEKKRNGATLSVLEQNGSFVKSIHVTSNRKRSIRSQGSGSSAAGTLSTIHEGKVDFGIPRPIWPGYNDNVPNYKENTYDSLVDDALLLYTSFNDNYVPNDEKKSMNDEGMSVKEILIELSNCINSTMDAKTGMSSEQMLNTIKEKISSSLEMLRNCTEDEMRRLCINLSNNYKLNSVVRAFSNSTSISNDSRHSFSEFNGRIKSLSGDSEEMYHVASGSSSSGFSDCIKPYAFPKYFDDLPLVNEENIRNAIIYGTLCRTNLVKGCSVSDKYLVTSGKCERTEPKKSLLINSTDSKPSVWQQYYGVNLAKEGPLKYSTKPTDIPVYPGGRPEADFTLDVPRSELLSKKMKENKKWRCRCRLLTSILGLIFFLLSVMAVSLMLTRGKRMFGSMA